MQLDALLAHAQGLMRVERPPALWDIVADDTRFAALLEEMIAAGVARGATLAELTLNVANVVVEPETDDDAPSQAIPTGEFVAISVIGAGDWGPETRWLPGNPPAKAGLLRQLDPRLRSAGARFAYVRVLSGSGSVTVFLTRATPP